MKSMNFKNDKNIYSPNFLYVPRRRNHIAHVIGWNMIVHGGIDIAKEFQGNEDIINLFIDKGNEEYLNNISNKLYSDNIYLSKNRNNVLGDFMALDLGTLKWMNLTNITHKVKGKRKFENFNNLNYRRAYHCSCLVLSSEHCLSNNFKKLNIYKNDKSQKEKANILQEMTNQNEENKKYFDFKYEGIYIFGGVDENLQVTNSFFILHCFRNPLVVFEPSVKGAPPSPRQMASMNFNNTLNFITIYGGKDSNKVFDDLFILDIMNFQWIKIELFGIPFLGGRFGHCSGIIGEKLLVFGGLDEEGKYLPAKVLSIDLDILRNKRVKKMYEFATSTLKARPNDKTALNVLSLLSAGAELPPDIYPFLQLDE